MKKQHITLTDEHRTYLEELTAKDTLRAQVYKRAIALLELDRGKTFSDVAQTTGVVIQTISIWAKKYQSSGLALLTDKSRPGRPVQVNGEQRAKITALACSEPPEGHGRWSLRLLADKAVELEYVPAISHTEVATILKKR
jgi:putative transposase